MTLDKEAFLSLIGNLADKDYIDTAVSLSLRGSNSSRTVSVATIEMPKRSVRPSFHDVTLHQLEFVGILGVGGFGRVELCRNKKNPDESFALKCMKKVGRSTSVAGLEAANKSQMKLLNSEVEKNLLKII